MNRSICIFSLLTLMLPVCNVYSSPQNMITHNKTSVESNAYIDGTRASPIPSKAHETSNVPWIIVQLACFGKTINGKCPALIKMASNTANPIVLGTIELTLATGEISPKYLSANGYTLTVNGPGEATLTTN